MKWIGVAISVAGLCLLLSCDSEKNDQYSGLGELVAERQEARKLIAEENAKKKNLSRLQNGEKERKQVSPLEEGEPVSAGIVFEKQIEILDSESKLPLARGVAYMNKSGQIVKIKVYRK